MVVRKQHKGNSVATTLAVGISSSDLTAVVVDGSSLPDGTVGPFAVTVDRGLSGEEKILVTSRSGNNLVIGTRGYDGTVAGAHSSGGTVLHTITAVELDEANAHIVATSGVHGVAGDVVGTTDTQTLSGKTLTTPTIGSFINAIHTHADAAGGGPASGDSRRTYLRRMCPVVSNDVTITNNGGSTLLLPVLMQAYAGATVSQYTVVQPAISTQADYGGLFLSGIVDVTFRLYYTAANAGIGTIFLGVSKADAGGVPPSSQTNGGWIVITDSGAGGVISTLTRAASVTSTGTTTASTVAVSVFHDYRITYPLAGGTATVYVDNVQVGTLTVPAIPASSVYPFNLTVQCASGTRQLGAYVAQITVTEG